MSAPDETPLSPAARQLLELGDPAQRLRVGAEARVERRLRERGSKRRGAAWQRWALVGALVSGLALAGVGAWQVLAPVAPPPQPVAPPPVPVVVAPSPSALEQEAAQLQLALAALTAGSPEQALVELDAYAARFPQGVLSVDARVARARAHLAAKQTARALEVFETLPLGEMPAALVLQWADALVGQRRCARALELVNGLDAQGLTPDELEVATRLRSSCGGATP